MFTTARETTSEPGSWPGNRTQLEAHGAGMGAQGRVGTRRKRKYTPQGSDQCVTQGCARFQGERDRVRGEKGMGTSGGLENVYFLIWVLVTRIYLVMVGFCLVYFHETVPFL